MSPVRIIEIATWSVGALLLCAYGGTRSWYALARSDAIAAFEAARPDQTQVGVAYGAEGSRPTTSGGDSIDTSAWSPNRIEVYRKHSRSKVTPEAVLHIPRLELVVPLFDGTSDSNLNRGAGRIEGTARIGEPGNLGIAAHRDGFFRALNDVQIGDALHLEHPTATQTYVVVQTRIVEPSDVSVLRTTGTSTITLVTCYPFYFVGAAPKRFIVRAQLVSSPAESGRQSLL